ncbi:MAG: hypothetical protein OHK006_15300 [Thermodesulfovibrionales bacterium]
MIRRSHLAVIMGISLVFAFGMMGAASAVEKSLLANVNYSYSKTDTDGEIERQRSLNQNYTFSLRNRITPSLSYQLFARAYLSDQKYRDIFGYEWNTYRRQIEPLLEIELANPIYSLLAGYRRTEAWDTKSLVDRGRLTTEYYYSRFQLRPRDLPSLDLEANYLKRYDYSPRTIDQKTTTYTASSNYNVSWKGLQFSYTANYLHSFDETPLALLKELTSDNFNGSYSFGFNRTFWGGRLSVSSYYQGNYIWNRRESLATGAALVLTQRVRFGGLYDRDTTLPLQVSLGFLNTLNSLIDGNIVNPAGAIDLVASPPNHNIGVSVAPNADVNRLYLYVQSNNISADVLRNPANWQAYTSNNNFVGMPDTLWTPIAIQTVNTTLVDAANNIYRYEIVFTTSHRALYFKVINLVSSSVAGAVLVTEVEAYGPESTTTESTVTMTTFTQGVTLNATFQAHQRLRLGAGIFINRSDLEPSSVPSSIGGVFANIVSKNISGSADMVNVTRSYTADATWEAHRLLTTSFRATRNEAFDNQDRTDFSSNIYNLSFTSAPLPTVDANLSLTRNESYTFDDKLSTNHNAVLTLGTRLYANVNMITDLGYLHSKSHLTDITSKTWYVTGTVSAILSPRLSGSLRYGLSWTDTESIKTDVKELTASLTYRPGRFINLTGNFTVRDDNSNMLYTTGFLVDWLPLQTIRLNLTYQYTQEDPRPDTIHSLSSYVLWKITKFMDAQLTYTYTREEKSRTRKNYSLMANLNCRF